MKSTTIINTTKEKAFKAITIGIDSWWGYVDNPAISKVGDEFSILFEEETEWRFEVSALHKFDEVRWTCIYANHHVSNLTGIKEEWLNSEIVFKFHELGDYKIELFFEHQGLTPALNCYQICNAGWTHFIGTSLKQYLETGKGAPNLVERFNV